MHDCIFCKIVSGELPHFQLFEDDMVKAFLDRNPSADGHLLVIPKKHFEDIFVTPDEYLSSIQHACKKMAWLCKEKLGATGVNILNASGRDAQQSVFHLHFHVVPRFEHDGLDLGFHGTLQNLDTLQEIQQKLLS